MSDAPADTVLARHRRRCRHARLITVDVDVTADPTHGAQQLAFFNGFYDTWCYLPLVATLTFDDEGAADAAAGQCPGHGGVCPASCGD